MKMKLSGIAFAALSVVGAVFADDAALTASRTISHSLSRTGNRQVTLTIQSQGLAQRLYLAWGATAAAGDTTNGWEHVEQLADVGIAETSRVVTLPDEAQKARFFLQPIVTNGTAVAYLHSTGTDEYIDTGFTPNQNTRADIHFEVESGVKEYPAPMGYNATGQRFYVGGNRTDNYWYCQYAGRTVVSLSKGKPGVVGEHTFSLNKNVFTVDGLKTTLSAQTFTAGGSLYVFTRNGCVESNYTKMKLFTLTLWNNGTLARNYVPARDAAGTPCLYDIKNANFVYGAAGKTALTAGDEVWTSTPAFLCEAVVSAVWTGTAHDDNEANPSNWVCRGVNDQIVPDGVPQGDVRITLATNAVWQSTADFTGRIDLAGFSLTVPSLVGTATITNSSTTVTSELHVNVAKGTTTANTGMALGGKLTLVKDGTGSYTVQKAGPYTGNTRVCAGTFKVGMIGNSGNPLGVNNSSVTVDAQATFDQNGQRAYQFFDFILNGGTFANSVDIANYTNYAMLRSLALTADSALDIDGNCGLFNASNGETKLGLANHTLSMDIKSGKTFLLVHTTAEKGTIAFTGGGTLHVYGGWSGAKTYASDLSAAGLVVSNGALKLSIGLTVGSYEARSSVANTGSAVMGVKERFTPVTGAQWYGCTLQNGATLDLSQITSTNGWPLASGNGQTVKFADAAAITIDWGDRVVKKDEQLVSWTTKPSNLAGLKFSLPAGVKGTLDICEDGIYYRRYGLEIIIR